MGWFSSQAKGFRVAGKALSAKKLGAVIFAVAAENAAEDAKNIAGLLSGGSTDDGLFQRIRTHQKFALMQAFAFKCGCDLAIAAHLTSAGPEVLAEVGEGVAENVIGNVAASDVTIAIQSIGIYRQEIANDLKTPFVDVGLNMPTSKAGDAMHELLMTVYGKADMSPDGDMVLPESAMDQILINTWALASRNAALETWQSNRLQFG